MSGKTAQTTITTDCTDQLEKLNLQWPQVFYVCKQHKDECFLEYEQATLSAEEPCELCHPKDNDSWGG